MTINFIPIRTEIKIPMEIEPVKVELCVAQVIIVARFVLLFIWLVKLIERIHCMTKHYMTVQLILAWDMFLSITVIMAIKWLIFLMCTVCSGFGLCDLLFSRFVFKYVTLQYV